MYPLSPTTKASVGSSGNTPVGYQQNIRWIHRQDWEPPGLEREHATTAAAPHALAGWGCEHPATDVALQAPPRLGRLDHEHLATAATPPHHRQDWAANTLLLLMPPPASPKSSTRIPRRLPHRCRRLHLPMRRCRHRYGPYASTRRPRLGCGHRHGPCTPSSAPSLGCEHRYCHYTSG
jgi:hypothetical protein